VAIGFGSAQLCLGRVANRFRLRTTLLRPRATRFRLRTTLPRPHATGLRLRKTLLQLPATGLRLRITSLQLRATGLRLRTTLPRLRPTLVQLRAAEARLRATLPYLLTILLEIRTVWCENPAHFKRVDRNPWEFRGFRLKERSPTDAAAERVTLRRSHQSREPTIVTNSSMCPSRHVMSFNSTFAAGEEKGSSTWQVRKK
jgi:hypothetical protein